MDGMGCNCHMTRAPRLRTFELNMGASHPIVPKGSLCKVDGSIHAVSWGGICELAMGAAEPGLRRTSVCYSETNLVTSHCSSDQGTTGQT